MRNKSEIQKLAKQHITELFKEAEKFKNQEYRNKYVKLAIKIAQKAQITIPSNLKKLYCKHCNNYFVQGENVRVRTREGKLVYYCLNCKKFYRLPYIKEQKTKRKNVKQPKDNN